MKSNEKGSTLIMVLLVIVIFSVIGVSLISQVTTERNLTINSEEHMQARYLAESGLTYFEKHFKKEAKETLPSDLDDYKENLNLEELNKELNEELSEEESLMIEEIKTLDEKTFEVYSEGIVDSADVTLVGRYEFDYDVDIRDKREKLLEFNSDGVEYLDFSEGVLLDLDLLDSVLISVLEKINIIQFLMILI